MMGLDRLVGKLIFDPTSRPKPKPERNRPMTKMEYIRKLHDLAYVANLADSDRAEEWQLAGMAHHHVQPMLDIIESMLTREQYQCFLDCFGDFASFAHHMKG
jgi:hypothetical protein